MEKMTHKGVLLIQKDHVRVLAYEKNANMDEFGLVERYSHELTFNLVVGSEDMTLSWADFVRLLEVMTAVNDLFPQE